jgi:probable HAF family extracellular repeat protein
MTSLENKTSVVGLAGIAAVASTALTISTAVDAADRRCRERSGSCWPRAPKAGALGSLASDSDTRGRRTRIDVPGAAGTAVFGINDRGEIAGVYSDTDPNAPSAEDRRGFLRDRRGRFTMIHVPGSVNTQAFGVNNRGQVVGDYTDADGMILAFLWDKVGSRPSMGQTAPGQPLPTSTIAATLWASTARSPECRRCTASC